MRDSDRRGALFSYVYKNVNQVAPFPFEVSMFSMIIMTAFCFICDIFQAVCCSDHIHCCPHGYTCDTKEGKCQKGDHIMDMLQKVSAVAIVGEKVENVPCPGGQEACPDQTTCCQMASGQYACCPAPKVSLTLNILSDILVAEGPLCLMLSRSCVLCHHFPLKYPYFP